MKGLRARFPDLIIGNCTGGAQRGDFGTARYSNHVWSDDIFHPASVNRKYSHGLGSIYPNFYIEENLNHYPDEVLPSNITPERLEWRAINRMMARFGIWYEWGTLSAEHLEMLNRAIATYRKIKPTLGGNRYVLCEPPVLVAPEHREHGQWEVYEYLSVDERTISVFFFRCMSSETEHRAVLKGLDEKAGYRMASHSGRLTDVFSGAELMESGIVCQLPRQLSADIVMLSRV